MKQIALRLAVATLGLVFAASLQAQAVTIDTNQTTVKLDAYVNTPTGSPMPIVFDTGMSVTVSGANAGYIATKSDPIGPVNWIRIVPTCSAVGLVQGETVSDVSFEIVFTTPIPGPQFTIYSAAASINNGNDVTGVFATQLAPAVTLIPLSMKDTNFCQLGNSCVLIDTATNNPPDIGSWSASLQGGVTYKLWLTWATQASLGESCVISSPLNYTEPFFEIHFGQSFQRLCADQNEDGMITPSDFTAWLANFNTNDLRADVNQNAAVEPSDFTAWVAAYNLGLAGPYCTP